MDASDTVTGTVKSADALEFVARTTMLYEPAAPVGVPLITPFDALTFAQPGPLAFEYVTSAPDNRIGA
jgi:hypothetical protein